MRWRLILEECNPKLRYIKGENNIVADALSRLNMTDKMLPEIPLKDKRKLSPSKRETVARESVHCSTCSVGVLSSCRHLGHLLWSWCFLWSSILLTAQWPEACFSASHLRLPSGSFFMALLNASHAAIQLMCSSVKKRQLKKLGDKFCQKNQRSSTGTRYV